MTTLLHDFGGALGQRPWDTFLWALTISGSQLSRVWSGSYLWMKVAVEISLLDPNPSFFSDPTCALVGGNCVGFMWIYGSSNNLAISVTCLCCFLQKNKHKKALLQLSLWCWDCFPSLFPGHSRWTTLLHQLMLGVEGKSLSLSLSLSTTNQCKADLKGTFAKISRAQIVQRTLSLQWSGRFLGIS
jgi:hypothetical protein